VALRRSIGRDFGALDEYARFLKDLFAQRNAGRRARLAEELAVMGELPARRMESAKRERVTVDSPVEVYGPQVNLELFKEPKRQRPQGLFLVLFVVPFMNMKDKDAAACLIS
jgi:hypothetical protein